MIRYLTAGESHGRGLVGILDGIPAGLKISEDNINTELA
ncbi:MAG: chorismate synthase, partial [Elusimicrobiota bacterium]|nr:chorismate synthase [Elusimicrobiota bacterium]